MLDIIRSILPYTILWINGFYSFIDILLFLTSNCYLCDTHTMCDIPPSYPISDGVGAIQSKKRPGIDTEIFIQEL